MFLLDTLRIDGVSKHHVALSIPVQNSKTSYLQIENMRINKPALIKTDVTFKEMLQASILLCN